MTASPSTGSYPDKLPHIVLPDHLQSLGIRENILAAISQEEVGSPVLYQMVDAAREWVSSHPMCINPEQVTKPSGASGYGENEAPAEVPMCKFFLQGKCKFGDKCRNRHGKKGHSPAVNGSGASKMTSTVVKKSPESDVGEVSSDLSMKSKKTKKQKPSVDETESSSQVQQDGKGKKSKTKKKSGLDEAVTDEGEKKAPLRTASDVISRILWDPDLPSEDFKVGYLDRFTGIIEKPFSAFSWEDIATVGVNVLAIPRHRIQYFKYLDEIVWDKRLQLDNFFGSRGGKVIQDIVAQQCGADDKTPDEDERETAEGSDHEGGFGIEIDDEEGEGEGEGEGDSQACSAHVDRNRPTHFVCFHITNEEVKKNVGEIQAHITKLTPQLAKGCLPVTALHVTLFMVRLENENQIATAREVMERARPQFIHILPRYLQLAFTGVSNFRERLAYVKVASCPPLEKFVSFLMECFHAAGLRTPGNHDEYTPHMTILKLSRPMQRELHTGVISPALYLPFQNTNVGSQHIESLNLCSMTGPKQDDGFYLRLAQVNNSLSGISPHFFSLLSKRLKFLSDSGVVTEQEQDHLAKNIQAGNTQQDVSRFDAAIEDLLRLGSEETMCSDMQKMNQQPVVVILRGLPGSGKSFLSTHCSEFLEIPAKVSICSADDFFTEGNEYKFSPLLLPKAHTYCLEQFLQALDEGKEFIIIDNTNSKLWEYHAYIYLCSILGCQYHVLEIPCPSVRVMEMFQSRNLHSVDSTASTRIFRRWEVDESAALVPPSLAYPRMISPTQPPFSLVSLCLPEGTKAKQALDTYSTIKVIYTAVFLSIESQWQLVAAVAPTHSIVNAGHVTLCFEPGRRSCLAASIGRKVTVRVTGSADDGKIQVATVELPRGVTSQNSRPHITVSREEDVSSKLANEMLQMHTAKPLYPALELEGVIGVMVREGNDLDLLPKETKPEERPDVSSQPNFIIASETDFLSHVLPKMLDAPGEEDQLATKPQDIEICTGEQKITQLYIFDFDGTLFNTPDPKEGRKLYEKCFGKKWERRGWLGWPESLLPPIKPRPGPALPEFREHIGCAGSLIVIVTGRIERTKAAIVRVLENFQVYPERLLLKPNALDESTPAFKSHVLQQMLEEFPNVTLVKFWDDIPANLAAIHRLSKSTYKHIQFEIIDANKMLPTTATKQGKKLAVQPPIKGGAGLASQPVISFLQSYLTSCGSLPTDTYQSAAACGMRFIADQFCKVVEFPGDPLLLVYPFGSFPLGRKGDLDLCFVAPPTFTPVDCMERLCEQLTKCGIIYLYKGHSRRCPRLKVMLEFPTCPSIDYDIVFASITDSTIFHSPLDVQLPAPKALTLIKPGDAASKAALMGPVLLHHVLEEMNGVVTKPQFGAVVEMVVQVFIAQRQKGNAYQCIRTFHFVRLLAEYIKAHKTELGSVNCDSLFKDFVSHAAELPDDKWKKLFGEFVPFEFIPKVRKVFEFAAREVSSVDFPSLTCYEELIDRSAPFPPEGNTVVEIILSGTNKVALWKLHTIVEAKLPCYIYQLISSGLDILPNGNTEDEKKFCFAVSHVKSLKQTLQQVLRPFWNEIEEFRKEKGVHIELNLGQPADINDPSLRTYQPEEQETATSPIIDLITQFASDPTRMELHLSSSLKSYERKLVRDTCEKLGLSHTTTDSGREKHVVIRK